MRAAISACSVSGIRSMPEPSRLRQHPDRLLDEERVALGLLEQRAARGRRQLVVVEQRLDQRLRVARAERLELDRRRAHAAAAPPRSDVEQLGPREADDQQRRVPDPGTDVLDELEERLLGPVDVLEDEHERLRARRASRPMRGRPRRSPAGCAPAEPPRARRRRARAGRRRPRPGSSRGASRRPRRAGRRRRCRRRP